MSIRENLIEKYGEDILLADGFDDAIIGVDQETGRVVYSVQKCFKVLEKQGKTEVEAMDHFYFNVSGSYIGEQTPIWCDMDI